MGRDYKRRAPAKRSRKKKKSASSGWVWLLVGLTVGLFVAALVYLNEHKTAPAPQQKPARASDTPSKAPAKEQSKERARESAKETARTSTKNTTSTDAKPQKETVAKSAPKTAEPDKKTAKPSASSDGNKSTASDPDAAPAKKPLSYDFYTILPEFEVEVPDEKLPPRAKPAPVLSQPENYLLQVGSFKSARDAEARKAELALLGIYASVQAVNVDAATYHRVRVGPFNDRNKLDRVKRTLHENGIDFIAIKRTS